MITVSTPDFTAEDYLDLIILTTHQSQRPGPAKVAAGR